MSKQARADALVVYHALATHFLSATRRELRIYTKLDSVRLHRALVACERQGLLLAEHDDKLAIASRLYELRKGHNAGAPGADENRGGLHNPTARREH